MVIFTNVIYCQNQSIKTVFINKIQKKKNVKVVGGIHIIDFYRKHIVILKYFTNSVDDGMD